MDGQAKVSLLLELKNKLKGGMADAKKYLSDNVEGMKAKLDSLKVKHLETFSSMKDEIPGFGRAMEVLGNPYVLLTAGAVALAAVFSSARAEAAQWDGSLAKVNVTAQLGKRDLKELSTEIMDIAKNNTVPLQTVPEAFNRIISAGLDTNTALAALEPTLQAAKSGFTDVETTAKAAVSTMTSSGIMDANRVYDILFATLNRGNAEFKDIAQYLPKIIPLAKEAGFSLEQVAGSFAFLTAQGQSSEAASTGLKNLFKSLSDNDIINGSKTKLGLKGLGIDPFTAAGEVKPLIDIISQLKEKTDGLTSEQKVKFFDQIGFDMETGTAIASMTQNVDKLRENIDFTTNSQGQLKMALENSAEATDSWAIAGNKVKATMIEIGQPINDSFGKMGSELMPYLETGLETLKALLLGIWDVFSTIGGIVWDIAKPFVNIVKSVLDWFNKSQLLGDLWSLIKTILSAIGDVISWVGDKIEWVYNNTIKPILDALEWAYEKTKDILGLGNSSASTPVTEGVQQQMVINPLATTGFAMPGQATALADGASPYGLAPTNLYQAKKQLPFADKAKDKKEKGGTTLSGKAEQVRNITFNNAHIGINGDVAAASVGKAGEPLTKKDIIDVCNEIFARFVHNLETSYE